MKIKDLPDTKNIRELLAITRPEVGWPMVAMDALVDITTICDLIEGGGLIRPDLAPQAGSVDVEAVIDAVTSFYTRKEDRNFAAQVARNTLDNLLAGAPVGGDARPAIPGLQEAQFEKALKFLEESSLDGCHHHLQRGSTEAAIKTVREYAARDGRD